MNNINYQTLQAEALINRAITNIPAGLAYYILKAKTAEIQKLYYEQAQREYAEVQSNAAQDQDNAENNLASASQEESEGQN